MSNDFETMIDKMTATTLEQPDYTGADGLLYCGSCRKPKEAYFPEGKNLFGRDRHPAECDCQRKIREEREAAEKQRKHLDIVEDLKRRGVLPAPPGGTGILNRTTGNAPKCRLPVPMWGHGEQIERGESWTDFVGQGRHRQKLFRRVHCKRPHGERNPGLHDEFCHNPK